MISALVACVYQPSLLSESAVLHELQRLFDELVALSQARRPQVLRVLITRVVSVWSSCGVAQTTLPFWASRIAPLLLHGEPFLSAEQRTDSDSENDASDIDETVPAADDRRAPQAPAQLGCARGSLVRVALLLFLESQAAVDQTCVDIAHTPRRGACRLATPDDHVSVRC